MSKKNNFQIISKHKVWHNIVLIEKSIYLTF